MNLASAAQEFSIQPSEKHTSGYMNSNFSTQLQSFLQTDFIFLTWMDLLSLTTVVSDSVPVYYKQKICEVSSSSQVPAVVPTPLWASHFPAGEPFCLTLLGSSQPLKSYYNAISNYLKNQHLVIVVSTVSYCMCYLKFTYL